MEIADLYEIYRRYPLISTDSRNCLKKSIFFALKGEKFDGNRYLSEALQKGCTYAISDDPGYNNNSRIILVENVLETLQQLANYHRKQLNIPIIAVTGTNGKTTTKELMAKVLSKRYKVLFTQGNLNNHIGVPLTLLRLNDSYQIAVIEMGANHQGEISFLCSISEPDFGLITNVGKGHLEGFGSFENVIKTKGELYHFLSENKGVVFINKQNPYLNKIPCTAEKIYYGTDSSDFIYGKITGNNPYLSFSWEFNNRSYNVETKLIGSYNLENVLAAVTVGKYMKVGNEDICSALKEYTPSNNRSQLKETGKNHLIIDTYNANPTSMTASVTNFAEMKVSPRMLILGDMLELGKESLSEHKKIIDLIRDNDFEDVYLCGEIFSQVGKEYFPVFRNVDELNEVLKEKKVNGFYILIKGSRGIRLEKTIDFL